MPQMMPMYWVFMSMSTMILITIILSIMYFTYLPPSNLKSSLLNPLTSTKLWIWKW